MIMKLHTLAPHESRMCPIDFGVKGQGHGLSMFENGFRTITDYVFLVFCYSVLYLSNKTHLLQSNASLWLYVRLSVYPSDVDVFG